MLGRQMRIAHPLNAVARSVQVVGVVSNHAFSADGRALPMIFLPMPEVSAASLVLVVRAVDLDGATRAVKAAVSAADPDVPIARFESLDARLDESFRAVRAMTWFGAELGLLALLLAAAGLHAVMSYTVRRRTREIGIRVAIGAPRGKILSLVLWQGFGRVAAGAVTGAMLALPLAFLLRNVFFGISPVDPKALLSTVAILVATALTAAALPAYRAAAVDPVVALRED